MLEVKQLRLARKWNQTELAYHAGLAPSVISEIENGKRDPSARTLRKLAEALEVDVADLFPKVQAPLPFEDEQRRGAKQVAKPLSPSERRDAAWMRRARLEGMLKHLTLRVETLRDQGKMHYEAGDPDELRPLFMDSMFLAEGAASLLVKHRKEAAELGGETAEERRLRDRLEHRNEDVHEVNDKIGGMWEELQEAEREAEREVALKERHPEADLPDYDDVPYIFGRKRAG